MESIKEIYKIGHGPSSSHTMGPKKAAERFLAENNDANHFEVTLYGSLAATGKGHLTDYAIEQSFASVSYKLTGAENLSKKTPECDVFQSFRQSK